MCVWQGNSVQRRSLPARPARAPPPASRPRIWTLQTHAAPPCDARQLRWSDKRTAGSELRLATHAASCAGGATPRAFASAALSSKKPAGKAPLTLARFAGGSSPRAAAGLSLSSAADAGGAGVSHDAGGGGADAATTRGADGSCGRAAGNGGVCAAFSACPASGTAFLCAARSSAKPGAGRAAPLSLASALARNSAWSFALSIRRSDGPNRTAQC